MNKMILAVSLLFGFTPSLLSFAAKPQIVVYKSPTCGCCTKWEDHLKAEGFSVVSKLSDDMPSVKTKQGVPAALQSCHTGIVNGYVIEGHVPGSSIKKLIAQKPKSIKGLAVPGMPIGSPGMEGSPAEKYDVMSFTKEGKPAVFDKY